jgi:hypothetical protein
MKEVDIVDQLHFSYLIQQKTKCWFLSIFYWYVENALINVFACFHYHNTANKDFVFCNINLTFRSAVIYNLIGYALGVSVDRGILAEQPI